MRHALLLAGGQGRRFWPRSRTARPKQFMPFDGQRSLLRSTAERLVREVPWERQWVVTHRDYVDRVRQELPEIHRQHVIGEPRALNTLPAVALAAALIREEDPQAVMLVQAADHWIRDEPRFRALVNGAFGEVEQRGGAVLIGFRPTRPAVGYGYIALGKRLRAARGLKLFEIEGYKEKPTLATAKRYLAEKRYLWNGCLFFWHARTIAEEVASRHPPLDRRVRAALDGIHDPRRRRATLESLYRGLKPISLEHGVVERMPGKLALEGDCGWEDVGTWGSLAHLFPSDATGNVTQGPHLGLDTHNCLVLNDKGVVVTLGVRDLIVVKDGDAVIVLPRKREGEMREVVERLQKNRRFHRLL